MLFLSLAYSLVCFLSIHRSIISYYVLFYASFRSLSLPLSARVHFRLALALAMLVWMAISSFAVCEQKLFLGIHILQSLLCRGT